MTMQMISNENFKEYLKALDVNVVIRKIAVLLKPDKDITQNEDHFIIKTVSTFKTMTWTLWLDKSLGKIWAQLMAGNVGSSEQLELKQTDL